MRRSTFVVAVVLFVLAPLALVAQQAASPALGTEIVVEPDPSGDDLYLCRMVLRDLDSDEVLSAPTVRFRAGEPASVSSQLPSGAVFELEVEVDAAGETGRWSSEVRLDQRVVSRQSGSLRLPR